MVALPVSMASFYASAISVDFRHEYKNDSQKHASRMKMGGSPTKNLSMSLELKFKSPTGGFMDGVEATGAEIDTGYKFKLADEWELIPGMPVEFSGDNATYKPQLRLTYKPLSVDGLSISARYRLDVKPHESVKRFRHRYTANLGYKHNRWAYALELNQYYAADGNYHLYDNGRSNYENNLTVRYSQGKWSPWFEVGDVSVSATSDKRELRSRVGIKYQF
ncbi:N-acetylneuraminic acid outer membrane channel protein NanC [Shewanella sp. WXL01]|uniref:N-acetylneuraminic acid outer membrane channel protein NanC n=2 Tax=Shewanellaceae TaxID=267890 RepID=A0A411PMW7_9GAMM|nr:N-acetylneuraminic acid outer membrane channel protein NanC [Shewanella sp. WXL01]QBF84846.1 N-acetylneuraminic acid outer membrane channel protein NanC [Shewanella maritima]